MKKKKSWKFVRMDGYGDNRTADISYNKWSKEQRKKSMKDKKNNESQLQSYKDIGIFIALKL